MRCVTAPVGRLTNEREPTTAGHVLPRCPPSPCCCVNSRSAGPCGPAIRTARSANAVVRIDRRIASRLSDFHIVGAAIIKGAQNIHSNGTVVITLRPGSAHTTKVSDVSSRQEAHVHGSRRRARSAFRKLLEQFGGANGELAAAMQYSIQGLNCEELGSKGPVDGHRHRGAQPSRNRRNARASGCATARRRRCGRPWHGSPRANTTCSRCSRVASCTRR